MSTPKLKRIIELLRQGQLARQYSGLVDVRQHPAGGLALLNYTEECQYRRAWDGVTTWCRGLIIDTHRWEVAALPFPKFFNLGERPESSLGVLPEEPFRVFEKLDGSLGISYRCNGKPALATRGSFNSPEAERGTAFFHQLSHLNELPEHFTLLFEVICRDSRGLLDYDYEGLSLLAIVDRHTGVELSWEEVCDWAGRLQCRVPTVYPFSTLSEVLETRQKLPAQMEGYVVRFASGLRVKVKGEAYLALHKLAAGLTERGILESLATGTAEQLLCSVPEEFRAEVEGIVSDLDRQATDLQSEAMELFSRSPRSSDRKTFALWVQTHVPVELRGVLFQLLDAKSPDWYGVLLSRRARS